MKITIIGSFRKYYEEICHIIDIFENKNFTVLSPKKSFISDEKDGFVILNSDQKGQKPYIIQEHVFINISKSDCVYVWNPSGYLGNSTCFEIGKIQEMKKPLFFKEFPKDLPIEIKPSMIKEVNAFIEYFNYNWEGE